MNKQEQAQCLFLIGPAIIGCYLHSECWHGNWHLIIAYLIFFGVLSDSSPPLSHSRPWWYVKLTPTMIIVVYAKTNKMLMNDLKVNSKSHVVDYLHSEFLFISGPILWCRPFALSLYLVVGPLLFRGFMRWASWE